MRVIFKNTDNTIGILIPTPEFIDAFVSSGFTIQEAMEALVAKDVPNGAESEIVETSTIPTDRTFRNAWFKNGKNVDTDIPKAKDIAHTKRRADREELFKPLDIKATIPSMAAQAETDRQVIRDADVIKQTAIDNANNEAELKIALGM